MAQKGNSAPTTAYHVEIQQASKLANKINQHLDYVNYAHTVQQQTQLPTFFNEKLLGQQLQKPSDLEMKNNSGYQVVRNPGNHGDSLVLTKFDILEAFKGHGDLVRFLQE